MKPLSHLERSFAVTFRHNIMLTGILVILFSILITGCVAQIDPHASDQEMAASEAQSSPEEKEVQVKQFYLSPGDEISISILGHEEFKQSIKIPLSGKIFYPLVGEIDVINKDLTDIRGVISSELSKPRTQYVRPGDKISIKVFRNEEYNREIIIPSDSFIFFPQVGEIHLENKSLRELRRQISKKLAQYVKEPQVMIDILSLSSPSMIIDPQVSIEVTGFGGRKIYVLGEIRQPGVFHTDGQTDIVEALSLAGGLTRDANPESILLIRAQGRNKIPDLQLFDFDKVISEGNFEQNTTLLPGDIVYVPTSFIADVDRFFVHLKTIISPLVDLETGYWIGQNIEAGPRSNRINY